MHIENNTTINGRYKVVNLLGYGGMGVVYLAEDIKLNRLVAVKSIRSVKKNEKNFQDFQREAQFLAQLSHKNIVQIFDIVEVDSDIYLVMEYIKGLNLAEVIKQKEYSRQQALQWLRQIAEGLAAAHKEHIIHRDLKASNILISPDNEIKIADFGIARSTDATQSEHSGVAGSIIALSPEQINGEAVDVKSDIFAFAVLNYLLLFERHPFGVTDNVAQLIQNIVAGNFIEPKALNSDFPQCLADLIVSSLQVDRDHRPSSVAIFSETYIRILHDPAAADYLSLSLGKLVDDTKNCSYPAATKKGFQQNGKEKRKAKGKLIGIVLASIAFFIVAAFIVNWSVVRLYKKSQNPQYIRISEPIIDQSTEVGNVERYKQLARSVRYAFEQTVIEGKDVFLIPRNELVQRENVLDIRTYMSCDKHKCNVSVEKVLNDNHIVLETKAWTTLLGDYIEVHSVAKKNLRKLINLNDRLPFAERNRIDEKSYNKFVALYSGFLEGEEVTQDVLLNTEKLISSYPQYSPFYDLYCSVAIHLYSSSGDPGLLTKINNKLDQASLHVAYTPDLYASKFELMLIEQMPEEAMELAGLYRQNNGDPATYQSMLSRVEMLEGKYDEAEMHMLKSLNYRQARNTYYDLANLYLYLGKYHQAIATLERLFQLDPEDYYGLRLKALVYLAAGELKKSIDAYTTVLQIKEESSVLSNLGTAYFLNAQLENARRYFQKVLEKENNNPLWMLNLADVEFYSGNPSQAMRYYKTIIASIDMSNAMLDFKLAVPQAYAHIGDATSALKVMNDLLLAAPDNINVLYTAALVNALAEEKLTSLVYVEKSLAQGMGVVWFTLPMFNSLCNKDQFTKLLQEHGAIKSPCR